MITRCAGKLTPHARVAVATRTCKLIGDASYSHGTVAIVDSCNIRTAITLQEDFRSNCEAENAEQPTCMDEAANMDSTVLRSCSLRPAWWMPMPKAKQNLSVESRIVLITVSISPFC